MEDLFLSVLNMSLTASYVIAVILLARFFLKIAPKIVSYALWSVAGIRLAFPISFESVFSLIPFKSDPVPPDIAVQAIPRIDSGITIVDDTVSRVLPDAMPAVSVNPMQTIVAAGIAVWLIGIAAMLIYSVVSINLLKRQLRGAVLSERNIYETGNLKTPFVLGFIHPKIYIPSGLSLEEKSYIIRHEQMHIKRFDHIVKLAAFLILCLHWFNPLVWLAFVLMSADMEMSCDERVIKDMGGEIKKAYSASLLSMATGQRIINGSPLAFGEGNIRGRIKNVLNFKKPAPWIIIPSILLVAALCIGLSANKADYSDSDITNFPSYEYDRVTFAADASPYPQSFETITATLTNAKMEPGLMCGEAFGIVRYDGEVWRDVPFAEDLGFNDLGVDIPVGASKTYTITPAMFNGKLKPGNYRIVTAVWYADEQPPQTKHNVWADFAINALHVEIFAWKENSTVKYSVFIEATAARTEREIYENSLVFSDIAEVNQFLSGYQTGYMTVSLEQMNITDFTKQEMQAISESLRIPAENYSLGIGVYVPESPPSETAEITLDEIRALAEKGDALTFDSFENFRGADVSSNLDYHIIVYGVEGGYRLIVRTDGKQIDSVNLESIWENSGSGIDIRYNNVEEFLKNHPSSPAITQDAAMVVVAGFYPSVIDIREAGEETITSSGLTLVCYVFEADLSGGETKRIAVAKKDGVIFTYSEGRWWVFSGLREEPGMKSTGWEDIEVGTPREAVIKIMGEPDYMLFGMHGEGYDFDDGSRIMFYYDRASLVQWVVKDGKKIKPPDDPSLPSPFVVPSIVKFKVRPDPEKYTPAMSSTPGIRLDITYDGPPARILYEAQTGTFLTWQDSVVTDLGDSVEQSADSAPLYWAPDTETLQDDIITLTVLNEDGGKIAAATFPIIKREDGLFIAPDDISSDS